jgi:pimeloyl-ACP methyl ester carboxylesterase
MPAVLVHGAPETPVVWDPLRAHLSRADVTALRLPGFGAPAPSGFKATKEDYLQWLTGELERVGPPVDLVGHDWGGAFALRLACARPELIRSWVSDVAGLFDPAYEWHQLAQVWQTEGAGEDYFATVAELPFDERLRVYEAIGVTPDAAEDFVRAGDREMARCTLALYRSGTRQELREWAKDTEAAVTCPGLAVVPAADPFTGGTGLSLRVAARMGVRSEVLDGAGHWWMLEDPAGSARMLEDFWADIG